MKNQIITTWSSLFFTLFFSISAIAQETVRIASGEWPPFTSENLEHFGVYSQIVTQAFALEGVKVEYSFYPWPRSYRNVVQGSYDASLTWAPTPAKKKEVFFSDPVFNHKKVIFHLKSFEFSWENINDLKGVKIGATREYTYGEAFDRVAREGTINVEYTTTDITNLKKLFGQRIQLFPSDLDVGYYLIKNNFTTAQASLFTHNPKSIQETFTCVIFSKKNPERSKRLLHMFNRGLRKLKEQGGYDKLIEKFRERGNSQ